ncbi:hypothetical protein M427DRAFT_58392 [Gonapodya prolifera JEL478]|uniref:DUF659 domain-containing protein n=1 Tax=Gonapodya prolifera (strain JEL478) TaxID=1344416 RepID=A0A139AAC2_GONPJ|nr:hypothetical protein M427DRAFT_58392 [Gonapodya prolifera JEL478]|eukprot:KXS13802.1 hypothetical protein M427DRAFT_58392 [Gonapodya prolifera JEL478]
MGASSKFLGITTDGAVNNKTMVEALLKACTEKDLKFSTENHIGCVAHAINIAAQAAIKTFGGYCNVEGIPRLELIRDMRTQWNSTYAMLERALKLKEDLRGRVELLKDVMDLLKPFSTATDNISTAKRPTLGSVIPIFNFLMDKLESFSNDLTQEARDAAFGKLREYYAARDSACYVVGMALIAAIDVGNH